MNDVYLMTHDQIENCLQEAQGYDTSDPESEKAIGLCPVTELLELCEMIKKHHLTSLASFKQRIDAIPSEGIRCDSLLAVIIPLDQQRLVDSLFERDDQFRVNNLWAPGSDGEVRCMHSVRRLLLRPTEQTWWDHYVYDLAEELYAPNVEEVDNA